MHSKDLDFEPNLFSIDRTFNYLMIGDRKNLQYHSINPETKFEDNKSKINILRKLKDSLQKNSDTFSTNFNFSPTAFEWNPFESLFNVKESS